MGPGATKVNFFEVPSPADGPHQLLTTGPLQLGISCQGESTGNGEIKLIMLTTIPGPLTTLSTIPTGGGKAEAVTVTGSVTNVPTEETVASKEHGGAAIMYFAAGADGVPYLVTLVYGANTEEKSTIVGGMSLKMSRGCWFLAEEV